MWTLFYVAVCHAVRREPQLGVPAAQESLKVAEATANPTALSMARDALGLVLLNLRYVVRLLVRLGADHEAVVLHHCLVATGRPSPLDPARLPAVDPPPAMPAAAMSGPAAVAYARACLARFS